jgi:hypothetical protein
MRYHEIMHENASEAIDATTLAAQFPGIATDIKSVSEWMTCDVEALRFRLVSEPADLFANMVKNLLVSYDQFPKERTRANRVAKLLRAGQSAWPVFIEQGDPERFIMEGRHRIVAFLGTGRNHVPVAYVTKL